MDWFKKNGLFVSKVSDLKTGDFVYWSRGTNSYHTGIVVQTDPKIKVVHATTNDHKAGSIKETPMNSSNGQVPNFNQPFVGAGRFK